jgi:hypothetical protein
VGRAGRCGLGVGASLIASLSLGGVEGSAEPMVVYDNWSYSPNGRGIISEKKGESKRREE